MIKRKKVAITYEYNENWIGGTYYIQNLIASLNKLADEKKPELVIICKDQEQFLQLKEITGYSYLEQRFHERTLSILERITNKASSILLNKILIINHKKGIYKDIDLLFPAWTDKGAFSECRALLYWIPDFQEHYLPQFFTDEEIANRKNSQLKILSKRNFLLFSSESAKNDFEKFYQGNQLKTFVLPFAVTHPTIVRDEKEDIKLKYQIPGEYFICSNQFWIHKNHIVILKAISYLKEKGTNVTVVFTGKENDRRNTDYFSRLKNTIAELRIENNVKFLGFISRSDQLLLIENALAVIQPSLFEGWSTVIEDAKALGTKIIASNLDVHSEQLKHYNNKLLFSPNNFQELADCIKNNNYKPENLNFNYQEKIREYGETFIEIVNEVTASGKLR